MHKLFIKHQPQNKTLLQNMQFLTPRILNLDLYRPVKQGTVSKRFQTFLQTFNM